MSTAYWVAGPETRAKIDARIARQFDARGRQLAFAKELNVNMALWGEADGSQIWGIVPPEGWVVSEIWRRHPRESRHRNVWIPRRSTAAGKLLAKAMESLGYDRSFGVEHHFATMAMHTPGYRVFGKGKNAVYVVKHHKDAPMPADCKPLKTSEYFSMVEAEGACGNG